MSDRFIPSGADLDLARDALLEITKATEIGAPIDATVEPDGVITVYFECLMSGYPGWRWTVDLAHTDGETSILEATLTPGDGALLSPAWIPWSERLAEFEAAQALLAEEENGTESIDVDETENSDQFDLDDDDHDHHDDDFGDDSLDGVEIDEFDDSANGTSGESVLLLVGENESNQTESKSDDASPEPPLKSRRNQRAKKKKQSDEGEKPED